MATTSIRAKRAERVDEVDDWEQLRTTAQQIRDRVLRHLDTYLLQAEESMSEAGITVHWASDADETNRIVADTAKVRDHGAVVEHVTPKGSARIIGVGADCARQRDGGATPWPSIRLG